MYSSLDCHQIFYSPLCFLEDQQSQQQLKVTTTALIQFPDDVSY